MVLSLKLTKPQIHKFLIIHAITGTSGSGKEKCKYDFLIKKEDLDNHTDDIDIVKQIRQIIVVEEVLAPWKKMDTLLRIQEMENSLRILKKNYKKQRKT